MSATRPRWLDEAAALPLGFAQVREDPALDRELVQRVGGRARVLMVASGGCTAASLAASAPVSHLHLVDPNPSQLALTRLKLQLLETAPPEARLAAMGHLQMSATARDALLRSHLAALGLAADLLGPSELVARLGPDHAGRYERLFAALRDVLWPHRDELTAVLGLHEPAEQGRRASPETELGRALDSAFAEVMCLPNLLALFGPDATRNPREPFARHFAGRTRRTLQTQPAGTNPFLWQMLLGRFAPGAEHEWLRFPSPTRMPQVTCTMSPMAEVLRGEREAWDLIHLSNILDWLSPDQARVTLDLAWAALRPGGRVIIRQLNSTVDVPVIGDRFEWDAEVGADMLERDRSFFYRAVHVGRRA